MAAGHAVKVWGWCVVLLVLLILWALLVASCTFTGNRLCVTRIWVRVDQDPALATHVQQWLEVPCPKP